MITDACVVQNYNEHHFETTWEYFIPVLLTYSDAMWGHSDLNNAQKFRLVYVFVYIETQELIAQSWISRQ